MLQRGGRGCALSPGERAEGEAGIVYSTAVSVIVRVTGQMKQRVAQVGSKLVASLTASPSAPRRSEWSSRRRVSRESVILPVVFFMGSSPFSTTSARAAPDEPPLCYRSPL